MPDMVFTDDYIREFLEVDLPIENYFVYENDRIGGALVKCFAPNGTVCIMCIHDVRLLEACVDYLKRMRTPVLHSQDEVDTYVAGWSKSTNSSK